MESERQREGEKERRREGEKERDGKRETHTHRLRLPADPPPRPGGAPLDGPKKADGSKDDQKGALGSFLKVNAGVNTVRARPGRLSTSAVFIVNRVCMALLYGREGRLTA
jgi:hypothetical protein